MNFTHVDYLYIVMGVCMIICITLWVCVWLFVYRYGGVYDYLYIVMGVCMIICISLWGGVWLCHFCTHYTTHQYLFIFERCFSLITCIYLLSHKSVDELLYHTRTKFDIVYFSLQRPTHMILHLQFKTEDIYK